MNVRKVIMGSIITALCSVLIPSQLFAVGLYAQDELAIAAPEPASVYAAAGLVQIDERINGNVVVAGGSITINGDVSEDVVVAGGSVVINGTVYQDVLAFGGTVVVNGRVVGDVAGAGGSITIGPDASIGRDVVVAGGTVTIHGAVVGSAHVAGQDITLNGVISGDAKVATKGSLVFGDDAVVRGSLHYMTPTEMDIPEGTVLGTVEYLTPSAMWRTSESNEHRKGPGLPIFAGLMVLVVAVVFALRAPQGMAAIGGAPLKDSGWQRLGLGVLGLFVGPIVALILMMTGIGALLGAVVFFAWLLVLMVAWVFSFLIVGNIVVPIDGTSSWVRMLLSVAAGFVLISVLGFIPVIGGIAKITAFLIAIGGVLHYEWNAWTVLKNKGIL